MSTLQLNQAGEILLTIADLHGEGHDYVIEAALPGLSLRAYHLLRLDTLQSYRVVQEAEQDWFCDCRAYKYRKDRLSVCKHIAACQELSPRQQHWIASAQPATEGGHVRS